MILREEQFEQTAGLGTLELKGDLDLELVLFLNGEPLVYDAYDCAGSIGRFTVFLPMTQCLAAQMQIETNAEQGFHDETPLQEQVALLLKLLPNGSYRLLLEDLVNDETSRYEILDWGHTKSDEDGSVMGYYPDYGPTESKTFITIQPDKLLDETRINFYATQILHGKRPALLVLRSRKEYDTAFIIDGHHKLKAYVRCGVSPRTLSVEFERTEKVTLPMARHILKDVKDDDIPRYLRDKQGSPW